jgi:hypothetical protein
MLPIWSAAILSFSEGVGLIQGRAGMTQFPRPFRVSNNPGIPAGHSKSAQKSRKTTGRALPVVSEIYSRVRESPRRLRAVKNLPAAHENIT